jgi:hypothetical protein
VTSDAAPPEARANSSNLAAGGSSTGLPKAACSSLVGACLFSGDRQQGSWRH